MIAWSAHVAPDRVSSGAKLKPWVWNTIQLGTGWWKELWLSLDGAHQNSMNFMQLNPINLTPNQYSSAQLVQLPLVKGTPQSICTPVLKWINFVPFTVKEKKKRNTGPCPLDDGCWTVWVLSDSVTAVKNDATFCSQPTRPADYHHKTTSSFSHLSVLTPDKSNVASAYLFIISKCVCWWSRSDWVHCQNIPLCLL